VRAGEAVRGGFALAIPLLLTGCLDLVHFDQANPEATKRLMEDPGPTTGPLDVAIALGCPAGEDGRASACERCRVKSALRAYRDGEVANVLMTGGAAHSNAVEADVMAELAIARGLPPDRVEREPRALTTWMNLRYAQRIMKRRGWSTALIVSTADHLPRAQRFADWYGIPARYRACDRDLPEDDDAEWSGPIVVRAKTK
jgi:vancomycin permeability regulator SanA